MPPMTSTTMSMSSRATRVGGVGGEQGGIEIDIAFAVNPADRDTGKLERDADPGREIVGLLGEQPGHLGADNTTAEQGDP